MKRFGFTLIELLVVISIIGILAAAGLVVFTNAQKRARSTRMLQDFQAIEKAMQNWVVNDLGGDWPDYNDVVPTMAGGTTTLNFSHQPISWYITNTSFGNYMKVAPTAPTGHEYRYYNASTGTNYNVPGDCAASYYYGANLFISAYLDNYYYENINNQLDNDTNLTAHEYCGKMKGYRPNATQRYLWYMVDRNL